MTCTVSLDAVDAKEGDMATRKRVLDDPATLTMTEIQNRLRSDDLGLAQAAMREVAHLNDVMASVRAQLEKVNMPKLDAAGLAQLNELTDQVARAVRNRLTHIDPRALQRLGPAHEVAESWAAQLPLTPSPLEDLTGPFYDTPSLRKWLGVTRQALDSRARHRSILALTTGDGTRVYPAWQWRTDKSTVPHLAEVLPPLLDGSHDPWTVALWMSAPVDWGDGREVPAWKWLDDDRDPTPVLDEARVDGARWAS